MEQGPSKVQTKSGQKAKILLEMIETETLRLFLQEWIFRVHESTSLVYVQSETANAKITKDVTKTHRRLHQCK